MQLQAVYFNPTTVDGLGQYGRHLQPDACPRVGKLCMCVVSAPPQRPVASNLQTPI